MKPSRFDRRISAEVDKAETAIQRHDRPMAKLIPHGRVRDEWIDLPPDEELFDMRGID